MNRVLILIDDGPSVIDSAAQEKRILEQLNPECEFRIVKMNRDSITTADSIIESVKKLTCDQIVCLRLISLRPILDSLDDLLIFVADLAANGIRLRSLHERIDSADDLSTFLGSLVSGWQSSKKIYRSENPKLSQIKAKRNGTSLGRPRVRNEDAIMSLRRDGASISEIAAKTGCSTGTVHRTIKSMMNANPGPKS